MTGSSSRVAGFALPVTLVALLLIGVVLGSLFGSAVASVRAARAFRAARHAVDAAESGRVRARVTWAPAWNHLPVGGVAMDGPHAVGSTTGYTVRIERLSAALFEVRAEGVAEAGTAVEARQVVTEFVRVNLPLAWIDRPDTVAAPGLDTLRPTPLATRSWAAMLRPSP